VAESDPVERIPEPVVAVERLEGVVLVRLFGEHDAASAAQIQEAVTEGMLGGSGVAVSLAGVTFMDSAVVHALVIGDRKLGERGRRLALYAEPGSVADRVLELCRLNALLLFGDTLDEAVEFARQRTAAAPAV
jgi:anti-anti-sigma factor